MAAPKKCKACGSCQSWDNVKVVKGFGNACEDCRECSPCRKRLPAHYIGLKGYDGKRKSCDSCIKAARKARAGVLRADVTPSKGNGSIRMRSKSAHKLERYVLLEREVSPGVFNFIEFGMFRGASIHGAVSELVSCKGTFKKLDMGGGDACRISKSFVATKQTSFTNPGEGATWDVFRFIERPIKLLRHLGYRVVERRKKARPADIQHWEGMTYAEEYSERKVEIIESALSHKDKAKLEKISEKSNAIKEKLEEFKDEILGEIDAAPDVDAMISGIAS